MKFFSRRAQSTAEYAIVIALVIGAAIAMQVYVRRSMASGVKFATDKLKSPAKRADGTNATGQYEPYYLRSETDTARKNIKSSEQLFDGGSAGKIERKIGTVGEGEQTERTYKSENLGVADKD